MLRLINENLETIFGLHDIGITPDLHPVMTEDLLWRGAASIVALQEVFRHSHT
jgi:hypothetical protein